MNPPPHFKTLALVGPTASGKSAISLALAQHFPLEIISMDSALVYTGMDIGTAKPTLEERSQVPHHLIDIRDPASTYSAAEFAADAQRLIQQIHDRGRHVLLVGGTMLYLKALLTPLANIPSAQPHIRAELEAQAKALGWPALHAQLALVDAPTAQRLNPNDGQRIGRALEVFRATGRPLSDFHRDPDSPPPEPTLDCPIISLEPMDRAWLHQRIALRFAQMLEQGLIEEVQKLMHRPDLHMDLPSMRCVGYRQVWEVLTQHRTTDDQDAANPIPTFALYPPIQQAIVEKGVAATRQLAKRQLTWLRSMPERLVIACDTEAPCTAVLKQVKSLWSS